MNQVLLALKTFHGTLASNYMESEKFNCHAMEDARVAAVEKLEQWLTLT